MSKILCIIPARSGSKRIKSKNVKPFLGTPIILHTLEIIEKSNLFDTTFISTDSDSFREIFKKKKVLTLPKRSKKNSGDYSTTADVLREVLSYPQIRKMDFKYCCCVYPTAALLNYQTLVRAYSQIKKDSSVDCVYPIVKYSYPIQRALKLNNSEFVQMALPQYLNSRSQDLDEHYHDAGQFYFFRTDIIDKYENLMESNCKAIVLNETEVQDIDNEEDWIIAETKYRIANTTL